MYDAAAQSGWWHGPYIDRRRQPRGHPPQHVRAQERRSACWARTAPSGGTTRPAEGTQLANRNRKSYGSALGGVQHARVLLAATAARIRGDRRATRSRSRGRTSAGSCSAAPTRGASTRASRCTTCPTSTTTRRTTRTRRCRTSRRAGTRGTRTTSTRRGSSRWRRAATSSPRRSTPGRRPGSARRCRCGSTRTASRRRRGRAGHIIRLAQPLRGLIPMMFDASTLPPIEPPAPVGAIVPGMRLFECPHITAAERSYSKTLLEGQTTSDTLVIGNIAPEVDEPLNWTITEAVSDCATPSDLPWVGTSATSGSVASAGGSQNVSVRLQHRRHQRQHDGHRGALPRQQRRGRGADRDPGLADDPQPAGRYRRRPRGRGIALAAASTHANKALDRGARRARQGPGGGQLGRRRPARRGRRPHGLRRAHPCGQGAQQDRRALVAVRGRLARRNRPGDRGRRDRRSRRRTRTRTRRSRSCSAATTWSTPSPSSSPIAGPGPGSAREGTFRRKGRVVGSRRGGASRPSAVA